MTKAIRPTSSADLEKFKAIGELDFSEAERALLEEFALLELPEGDGAPLESNYHVMQIALLTELVHQHFGGRDDYFCGGNIFVYYSLEQAQEIIEYVQERRTSVRYKGPDFFVVLGVDGKKKRKSWIAWQEGGRYPDVIIEITSPSTKSKDTEDNLILYEQVFRTPEYFWYDESAGELQGYRLQGEAYVPIPPNDQGWLWSEVLGAWLGISDAPYWGWQYRWLRLLRADGALVPTSAEQAQETQ